jgi:anti-sigma B factor antagonist
MSSFTLSLKPDGTAAAPVLAVSGELDMYTAPEFEEELMRLVDSVPDGIVVDLLDSTFVDSTACRALLRAARRLRDTDARLTLVNRDPEVARILSVMGLDEFLDIVPQHRLSGTAAPAGALHR